jgi:rhodanese-related sulfurtransferase
LYGLAAASGKNILLYCAFGERSAMAVQASQDTGLKNTRHIGGGFDARKKAAGPLVKP